MNKFYNRVINDHRFFSKIVYLLLLATIGIVGKSKAQVSVTATAGVVGPTVYATLKASFDAINAGTHQGDIAISITANTVETATAILNSNGAPASYTSVTVKPSGAGRVITGNLPTAIIKLNGADNVTIDGFVTAGPARDLTITNTSTVNTSGVIWVASASVSNGASDNIIQNCIVTGSAGTTSAAAIAQSSGVTLGGLAETANSNNSYLNNLITRSLYGIKVAGATASPDNNTIISNNTINTIGHGGIYASTQDAVTISGNTISAVTSTTGSGSFQTSGIIVLGTINGGSIQKNTIFNIRIASVWGCNGIQLDATNTNTNLLIANNFIYDIAAGGFSGFDTVDDNGVGIAINKGGGYRIHYNSIDLSTNQLTSTTYRSAAIWIGRNIVDASLVITNNIFANRQTVANRFAIYSNSPATIFAQINSNDYFSTGSVGFVGSIQAALVNWQTATEQDDLSVAVNPFYISTVDLHLLGNSPLDGLAVPVAGITTDYDGDTRNATTPDIGADEFTPPNCTNPVINNFPATASVSDICASGSATLSASGYSFGVGISYQWEFSTVGTGGPWANLGTQTNPLSGSTGIINATRYYRLKVTCNAGAAGYSIPLTVTVNNPAVTAGPNVPRCGIGTVDLTATGTNLQWYAAASGGSAIGTGSPFTTPTITGTTTYYVSAASAGVNGSGGKTSTAGANGGFNGLTGLVFDATQPFTLLSVKMYPQASGQVTIQAQTSGGVPIPGCTFVQNFTGATSTGIVVPLNFPIPIGTAHRLVVSNNASSISIWRDFTGNTYPYILGTVGSITSGWISGNSATYYFFFDWQYTTRCESNRAPVTAIVNAPPALTSVSPAAGAPRTICTGSSVTLNAVGGGYSNYTWNPGALPNGSVVSPAVTTTYTLTADVPGGCRRDSTVTIIVNATPTPLTITPANVSICPNLSYQVITSGGLIPGQNIFTETAEVFPFTQFTSTGTNVTASQNTTYFQQGAASIHLTHGASANGSIESPNIALTSFTNPSLTFYQIAGLDASATSHRDVGYVEYSTDGGTIWTKFPASSYLGSGGLQQQLADVSPPGVGFDNTSYPDWDAQFTTSASTPGVAPATSLWKLETINLTTWQGLPNFKIRFRILANASISHYGWLLDNIKISGTGQAPVTWNSNTDLYTNAGHGTSITANSGNFPSVWYWTNVNAGPTTYTATATGGVGCTTSSTVTISATSATPSLTITANPAGPICAGTPVTFTAAPVNGGSGAAYNWKVNGGSVSGGSQVGLTSITLSSLVNTDNVTCDMSVVPNFCFPGGTVVTSNTISMTVNPKPVANNISGSTGNTVCIGTPNVLTETAVGIISTYQWFESITNPVGTNSPTYSAATPGSYTVVVTSNLGCKDTSAAYVVTLPTYTITATVGANGTISPTGAVIVDCGANQLFTITPNAGYSILDVLVDGVSNAGAIATGTYTFTNVTANGHTINATFFVAGCGSPATSYAGPDAIICAGPNFTLSGIRSIGGSATSGLWTSSGTGTFNPNNTFVSATTYTPSAADIALGTVNLTLSTDDPPGSCLPSTSTLTLTIKPSPSVVITGQIGLCTAGATTTWLVADTSATTVNITTFQWTYLGPVGTNNDSLFVNTGATGNYSVLVTGSNGCTATDAVTVNIFAPPTVTISGTGPICTDAGVDLNAVAAAGSGSVLPNGYQWYLNNVLISGATSSILTATVAGNYTAKATNSNGCVSTVFSNIITLANDNSALNGDYTIGVGPASCTNYLSFATAINDLNNRSISGDVRFSVPAGYTEAVVNPGLVLGGKLIAGVPILNNATNAGFTISFFKSGVGANPLLTAFIGGGIPTGLLPDGMFKLRGVDNVSITEIDLAENPSNSGNTLMEYGYGIFRYTATDGAQNNLIQSCNITLSKANSLAAGGIMSEGSNGIIVIGSVDTSAINPIVPTSSLGTNSNNRFYGNIISNVHNGMWLSGFAAATPFTLSDIGNDIGGGSSTTGNSILNFGNAGDVTAPNGIRIINQWGINVAFNTINNNNGTGVNTTNNLNGIVGSGGTSANAIISSNNITLNSGALGGQFVIGIDNGIGSTAASNAILINNNNITGSGLVAASAPFTGIRNTSTAATVSISGNTISNITLAGSGTLIGISNTLGVQVLNITNNIIDGNVKTGPGILSGITLSAPLSTNIADNVVSNNTIAGGGATCTLNSIISGGGAGNSYILDGNLMYNNSITNMATTFVGSVYGYINVGGPTSETLTDNIVRKLFVTGAASSTAVHIVRGLSNNTSGASTRSYLRNQVDSLYTNAASSGAIVGIWSQAGGTVTIANNKIHSLFPGQQGAGLAFAKGISINSGNTLIKVNNNMVSLDLSQAFSPAANNVLTGATALTGIEVLASAAPMQIYYNSVRLAGGGSGTAFGSSGISLVANTTTYDMRNNIVVNLSTAGGGATGFTTALRRTSAAFANYPVTSNNNLWYTTQTASTPIYYNGTTSFNTLAAFKTHVSARETYSIDDLPVFADITLNDLRLDPANNCAIDGMAQPIATYNDDYDAVNVRDLNAPDIGADEFDGTGGSGTWKGVNTNWMDARNWCGVVPTVTTDVIIPTGKTQYPVITTLAPVARNITVNTGASIIINNTGQLANKGSWLNNGTITNNGTIELNGTSNQAFPNSASTGTLAAMTNLTVNNPGGATIDKALALTGVLKPKNGIITLNNVLVTLLSDASGTARVDTVAAGAGFTYSGVNARFSVERYVSSATRTAWRFLSAPIVGTQTINAAWQEGQVAPVYTSTGYGMQIVGPGSTALGFDMNNAIPSLKTYSPVTNGWVSVPNTLSTAVSSAEGYMAFVRGDRGSNTFGSMSATTLRTSGQIKTGAINVSTADANTNKFISVGNPYPSAIDFASVATVKTGLQNVYYVWDPKLNSYGAYQTFAGPGFVASPGGGSYAGGNKFIESGQAFFVVSNAAVAPHSITINENSKVGSNVQVARTSTLDTYLSTKIYVGTGANAVLFDGNRVDFDASYLNDVDDNDALKLSNFGENIGILRDGKTISVERRAAVVNTDTIFYSLGQLKQQDYHLELTAGNLAQSGLTAFLQDKYLNTSTVIDLSVITTVSFTVNSDPTSKASDRFRLVFKQLGPVPVTFTTVTAQPQDKNILVSWKVENELNIVRYEIEHSLTGRDLRKLATVSAVGGGGATLQYSWLHVQPIKGDNFYRIKSIGTGNEVSYSNIVKANISGDASFITVYPNPIKDGMIGLSMNNQPAGYYEVKLYSSTSQLVINKRINYTGGNQRLVIPAGQSLAKGVYSLQLLLPDNRKQVFKIMVE